MASRKAESMLTPFLDSDDECTAAGSSAGSDDGSDASSESEAHETKAQKMKHLTVYAGLLGGTAVSAAAMAMSPSVSTFVMGGTCAANTPYSMVKERKIGKIPSLRHTINKLKDDAAQLEANVDALGGEIDALGPEADRAAAIEEELRSIADTQETNVNRLVELVQENAAILAKMRDNLRERIVQDIISIVVKSDRDNDNSIDLKEATMLSLRIKITLQEYDVLFNEHKFIRAVGEGSSSGGWPTELAEIIGVVRKVLPQERDRSDDSDDDMSDMDGDMYDMFHMAEGGGESGVSLMTCDKKKASSRGPVARRDTPSVTSSSSSEDDDEEESTSGDDSESSSEGEGEFLDEDSSRDY